MKINYDVLMTALQENVPQYGKLDVVFTDQDGVSHTKRIARAQYGGSFIVLSAGSRKYGQYLHEYLVKEYASFKIKVKKEKDPEEVWRKSWEQVVTRLAASGLWEEYKNRVIKALGIGYKDIKHAYDAYWDSYQGTYDEQQDERVRTVKHINQHLVLTKDDGTEFVDTDIIWYMNKPAKIKKMYFGMDENEYKLQGIKKALALKMDHSTWGRASYDVSYQYKAKAGKAWYSEEYRGSGNGHYYLALDATHALFYEDD